jgi:hypothetical protein
MWKFGVKPLVSDINSVHNALSQLESKINELLNQRFSIKGQYKDVRSEGYDHSSGLSPDTMGLFSRRVSTTRTTTKKWVYGAVKRIDPSKLPSINTLKYRSLAEQLGLSLDATDLWEAVPYSFVVDWFLPIQTFLEQFGRAKPDPSWLLTVQCWSSVKTETVGITSDVITPVVSSTCEVQGATGLNRATTWSRSEYSRTALTALPGGTPNTYIPALKWPSWAQGVTGIELLIQRIRRTLK